jgi:putative hemolysin
MKATIVSCAVMAAALAGCAQPNGTLVQPNFQQAFQAFGDALNKPAGSPSVGAAAAPSDTARQGKMVSINAVNIMIEEPRPAQPRWAGKRLQDTPLAGLFARNPITRPGDYWPRVSIRIVDYSETLVSDASLRYQTQLPGSTAPNLARPPECIKFDAVIWSSEKKSQRVDGVVLCNGDLKSGGNRLTTGAMRNYRTLMAPISISSEQVRTAGPRAPSQLLPFDTQEARALYGNGGYLFGEMFVAMGYRGPLDGDQRLWFVNLANK